MHLRQLAPVVLGAKGWAHYADRHFGSWESFKDAVNLEFGLSKGQLSARFFALTPNPGEDSASFVIRVEQERRAVQVNEQATLHCFKTKLS